MFTSTKDIIFFLIRIGVYFAVFSLAASAFSFLLYHVYYGSMIAFGMFLAPTTLNLIYYPTIGLFILTMYESFIKHK